MNDRYHDAHAPRPPTYTRIAQPTVEELIAVGSPLEPAKQTRSTPVVGKRYHTKHGPGTCTQVTPYQAQVATDDGEDPVWLMHGALEDITEPEEVEAITLKDLVYAIADLVSQLKEIIDEAERADADDCGETQQVETT